MKNDIWNLYWASLYNVKFLHNCSGSMLVEMNELGLRADLTNIPTSGRLSRAPKTVGLLLSKVTLGINDFSVVWIENLSNFKHFSDIK